MVLIGFWEFLMILFMFSGLLEIVQKKNNPEIGFDDEEDEDTFLLPLVCDGCGSETSWHANPRDGMLTCTRCGDETLLTTENA